MHYEIVNIEVEDEFKICPTCGYRDGFHSMLKKVKDNMRLMFVCPGCHDVFDVNLESQLCAQ